MRAFIDNGHPGTWAEALLFPSAIRVIPDTPFKRIAQPVEGGGDSQTAPAFTPVFHSLHSTEINRGE